MRFTKHAPTCFALLFTTAAVTLSFQQPATVCRAEFRLFHSSRNTQKDESSSSPEVDEGEVLVDTTLSKDTQQQQEEEASVYQYYGTTLKPTDVHYSTEDVKKALEEMRNDKRLNVNETSASDVLKQSATKDGQHVTLTLIGYKGGELSNQINQDRSIIVAPYLLYNKNGNDNEKSNMQNLNRVENKENVNPNVESNNNNNANINNGMPLASSDASNKSSFMDLERVLLGVFDGHAPLGELVSEYTANELPKLLASKLTQKWKKSQSQSEEDDVAEWTKTALSETFIELDQKVPADPSGGCTCSVILLQGSKIYVANAGDSRSFIVTYRPSTNQVQVQYITREDKPNLPGEKHRVERYGGQVYIPARGTSRVVYHDPTTGAPTGLAMSRSIGDWEAGKMGVIPDPIVDVLDINNMVNSLLFEDLDEVGDETDVDSYQVDPVGNIVDQSVYGSSSDGKSSSPAGITDHGIGGPHDDVYIFAVSATDGLMDYLAPSDIARVLAHSLFDPAGAHPVTAVEHLIFASANAWQQNKQGRYRDDIAIAVSALRRPPNSVADSSE